MHQKDVWSKISGRWRQSTHSMCIQRHAVLAMSFSGVQCQETTLNSFLALAFCVLPDVECHRFLFGCQALIELRVTLVSCRACGVSWAARGGAALLHRAGLQAARAQGHSRLPAGGHLRQGPAGEPLTSYQLHITLSGCNLRGILQPGAALWVSSHPVQVIGHAPVAPVTVRSSCNISQKLQG